MICENSYMKSNSSIILDNNFDNYNISIIPRKYINHKYYSFCSCNNKLENNIVFICNHCSGSSGSLGVINHNLTCYYKKLYKPIIINYYLYLLERDLEKNISKLNEDFLIQCNINKIKKDFLIKSLKHYFLEKLLFDIKFNNNKKSLNSNVITNIMNYIFYY